MDEETGAVQIERYVSVADVGPAMNPLLLEAQDEGGVVQGLGHSLFEEMVYGGQPHLPHADFRFVLNRR